MSSESSASPEAPRTNDKGQRICGAKSRRNPAGFCHNTAVIPPTYRCRMHGGKAKRGDEASAFVHGRYAATMPGELRDLFEAARNDPQVLDLHDDVALASATVAWLLKRWRDGEEHASDILVRVRSAWAAMKAANTSGDAVAVSVAAVQVDDALRVAPVRLESIRAEIVRQQNIKRRIIETAAKQEVMTQTMISNRDALRLLHQIVDACLEIVTDPEQRAAFGRAFERRTGETIDVVALPAPDVVAPNKG